MPARILVLLVLVLSAPYLLPPAQAELLLLYTAETHGQVGPCPVCGGYAMGGLARRATVFNERPHALRIAGAGELHTVTDPERLHRLGQAFQRLRYDLMAVTAAEDAALRAAQVDLPREVFGPTPQLRFLSSPAGPVAVIVFPASPADLQAVIALAEEARHQAGLVIGLSPWGAEAEQAMLATAPQALDLLLGAGPGPGSGGLFMNDGATVWLRPYTEGKTVAEVRIPTLPQPGTKVRWQPGDNLTATAIGLTHFIPSDPEIAALFP